MAFSLDKFVTEMKDLFTLMGWKMNDGRMAYIWEEVREFSPWALERAIRAMKDEERFTVPSFIRKLREYESDKRASDLRKEERQREAEYERLMEFETTAGACKGGEKCKACTSKYCRTGTSAVLKGCVLIASGKMPQAEVELELSQRFPVPGVWPNVKKEVPF
jgi:hypothetical protein